MATAKPGSGRTRRVPSSRTLGLTALLRRALDHRIDPQSILVLPNGAKGPANRLLRPLNTITAVDSGLHACMYGRVIGYAENTDTRSVFLHVQPFPGASAYKAASIMIRADQAAAVQDNLGASIGDVDGHNAIIIGTVRVARSSSRLYTELDNTSSLAYLP